MSTADLQRLGLFDPMPENTSLFVLTSTGDYRAAVLVLGLEGVKREVHEIFMGDATTEPDEMCAAILEQISDPREWEENGRSIGDGKPFWNIHWSFEDGSLDVQRINTVKA